MSLRGHLDHVDHNVIRGWAWDGHGQVRLRVIDGDRTIAVLDASQFRADLVAAHVGDGQHGFCFDVPGGLDPAVRHVIRVRTVLDGTELEGSPIVLESVPGAADLATPIGMTLGVGPDGDDGCYGHLDLVEREVIKGWAWNSRNPTETVAVQLFVDGRLLVRTVANVLRSDLASAGIGDGRHGFQIELPMHLSGLSRHVLHARIERGGRALSGSPQVVEAANAFDGDLETAVSEAVNGLALATDRHRVLHFLLAEANRVRQQIADDEAGRRMRERARSQRRALGPRNGGETARRRALVIDECLPAIDRDAGSQAILSHIRALLSLGYEVGFAAAEEFEAPDCAALRMLGVMQCGRPVYAAVEDLLHRQSDCFDLVYLHRVSTAAAYMALARRHQPRARLLYSVADLHHLRLSRQAKAEQRPELLGPSNRVRLEECTAAWQAHAVLTHSPVEADLLRRTVPAATVHEVPWAVATGADDDPSVPDFAARSGIAFVGHFGHSPNEDAVCWLIEEVMPLVWAREPTMPCLIAGSDITRRIHALGRPRVEILGHVEDLRGLWNRVRLAVAPLRFGAGIKGKVLNSFAAGVPCVMTPSAAEGLRLSAPLQGLVGDGPEAIAMLICRFHADPVSHAHARAAGLALIRDRHSEASVREALRKAIEGSRAVAGAVAA